MIVKKKWKILKIPTNRKMAQCDAIATWWNILLALYHIFREYLATWKNIFQVIWKQGNSDNEEYTIYKN